MTKGISLLRTALLCGTAAAVIAGSAEAASLEEALAAAYSNNPGLQAQRAAVRASDEAVPQALSGWRPRVQTTGTMGRTYSYSNARANKSQTRNPRGLSLSVSQPVFNGYQTVAATSAAEASVRAARARLVLAEQLVLLDAATAYMAVVRDLAVLGLNTNNEQVLLRQLEATRDRFEVGELTRTDVSQAEARYVGATADRIRAEGVVESSRAAYRNVVGAMPENLVAPSSVREMPESEETAIRFALDNHPSLAAAEFDEVVARHQVKQVRGELLPSVALNGSLSRNYQTASPSSRINDMSLTAVLTVPLYQSGAVYSRLRQARQSEAQLRMIAEQARRDVTEGVTQAWKALKTAQARGRAFDSQIKASEIALDGVEREAQVGSRTVLDVLDAEQELLDSKVNQVRAKSDELNAAFQLKAAVGQLTARDMELTVDMYDPKANYDRVRDKWAGGDIQDAK